MTICSVNNISKMYGGSTIFEEINFEIRDGERVGLVGRNGSGKTTLFKLLAGQETTDSGAIHWKKGTIIGSLAQIPDYSNETQARDIIRSSFSSLLTMETRMKELECEMGKADLHPSTLEKLMVTYGHIQDQFTSQGGYEIDSKLERVVNGLQLQSLLDKTFAQLSGGEKTKIGLAQLLLTEPNLLLLDEPTNHLDLLAIEWLGDFLQEYEGTVVMISHDRYFLDQVVTRVLDLEDGEVASYIGNYSTFVKLKEERLLKEFQDYEEQQKKIKKMKEAIKRLREWANRANPPSEGLHKRARNMERALERMEKLDRPILQRKKMNLDLEVADRSGKDVLTLEGVSKRFNDQLLFEGVHLHVQYQERVAIVGANGTGKSTLIKMLLGQETPSTGQVKVGSNVKVGYLSQHIFHETGEMRVIDAFREEVKVAEGEARQMLARFLFYGHSVFRKVKQLSGGERMRLRLAQFMHQDINLLILDEPTNHLDIESREVLEDALDDFGGTILAVSHDRYFLDKLFHKVYWIEQQKLYAFQGNFQYAREKMKEQSGNGMVVEKIKPKLITKRSNEGKDKDSQKSLEELEKQLEHTEELLAELNSRLLLETTDLEVIQQLYSEKEIVEFKIAQLYDMLEQLLQR